MKNINMLIVSLLFILMITGCGQAKKGWVAEHVATLSGFNIPECAVYEPTSGIIYLSNIECAPEEFWVDDSKGYVSTIGSDNKIIKKHWVNSNPEFVLHSPKGMCILGEHLYFADNTRLIRRTLKGNDIEVLASGFKKANDLATDGKSVWLSDTGAGKIYSISTKGDKKEVMSLESVNGLTFSGEKMFGVSWDLHEVYELDPTGKNAPVAFGLSEHFTNLDGIEVLDDGTFIVSDFNGNKVCTISQDRTTVKTIIEDIPSPADIGLNRKEGLLYVPRLLKDKLSIYRIKKN